MTGTTEPIALDVLLLPAFAADDFDVEKDLPDEFERWRESYEFENSVSVSGANMPVYYTDDGIGITSTGMGKADAAATVTAILAGERFDCSETYFLTVGIAGAPPTVGTLGSVFVADSIVDWDRKHRWAARDGETTDERERPLELLSYRPHDYVYHLNDDLVTEAVRVAKSVELLDSSGTEAYRNRYEQQAARSKPGVDVGTTLCGDEFWHGATISEHAQWLTEQYGAGTYATTEMEEMGTATALDRFGLLDRYLSVRGVANFDRPHDGQSIRESLHDGVQAETFDVTLENVRRVGSAIVEELRDGGDVNGETG
ncbi:purine or other phosphorylase family 1 [Haladaptatus paucihalophilus DX253]|uniref:Purine nucleoside permease n=1 Tax=Haladaptatus paucihalophilus DX253 TaxID=797209 RepID=E7QPP6_HALPU|nr:purine or other phosphorylase family 1 [Haladaptatus paucihalophilus]EFW93548.1 purine or other phosphorylase family 1 [Haladaptatus paucihalophilus DX253]SHL21915.1 Purine nucleoside permease [Haladaptatus paucihalophilus DX253]